MWKIVIIILMMAFSKTGVLYAESGNQLDLDGVCAKISNSYECGLAIEAAQLPRAHGRVRRENGVLRIALRSGKTAEFKDKEGEADVQKFLFRKCSDAAGKCVVFEQLYENGVYVVVDLKTGRQDIYPG